MRRFNGMLLFAAVVLLSFNALAAGMSNKANYSKTLQNMQNKENAELRQLRKNRHERINWDKELNLTEEQKVYVAKVLKDSQEKIGEQMKIIQEAHKKIAEIQGEDDEKVRQILNAQQKVKFDKVKRKQQKAKGIKPEEEKPSRKKIKQY